jgi:hypothetical protein
MYENPGDDIRSYRFNNGQLTNAAHSCYELNKKDKASERIRSLALQGSTEPSFGRLNGVVLLCIWSLTG